jgi:hypothetical protein
MNNVFSQVMAISLILFYLPVRSVCADQSPAVADAIARIVEGRDQAAEYVIELKRKFKPDDEQYQRARDLYVTALSKNNAWIATVSASIRNGKTKKLQNNASYEALTAEADQATKAFIQYVQSTRAITTRAVPPQLVAALGMSIWDFFKDQKRKERAEEADRFEKQVQWSRWEDIQSEM